MAAEAAKDRSGWIVVKLSTVSIPIAPEWLTFSPVPQWKIHKVNQQDRKSNGITPFVKLKYPRPKSCSPYILLSSWGRENMLIGVSLENGMSLFEKNNYWMKTQFQKGPLLTWNWIWWTESPGKFRSFKSPHPIPALNKPGEGEEACSMFLRSWNLMPGVGAS